MLNAHRAQNMDLSNNMNLTETKRCLMFDFNHLLRCEWGF